MPPLTNVPSRQAREVRYGLIASLGGEAAIRQSMADLPSEGGDLRWESGFNLWPDDCDSATAAFDPLCGGPVYEQTQSSPPAVFAHYPVGIWDSIKCSTLGGAREETRRRSVAKLLTSTSHKVENELWSGTLDKTRTGGAVNVRLAQATGTTILNSGSSEPLAYALARLQLELGSCSQESRGMIHATVDVASLWFAAGLLRREGALLLDAFDNIVVAGSGYDGSGPNAEARTTATAWAYATTMIDVRLSEIIAPDNAHWVDTTNNIEWWVAERIAAATWDGCCHVAVLVDTETVCA